VSLPARADRRLRPLYRSARSTLGRWGLDRRYGIKTAPVVYLSELGYSYHERTTYEPSGWHELLRCLPREDVGSTDVLVDIGSGMGRVVFEAALRYPFRRVIGVELAQQLHDVAVANIERTRDHLAVTDVDLVCADASTWPVPDDVTVVYLFNPVLGSTFGALLGQVVASLDRRPRPLRLLYRTPLEHEQIIASGRFRRVRVVAPPFPRRLWARGSMTFVYEAVGDPTQRA
jgi:hypothetical protein